MNRNTLITILFSLVAICSGVEFDVDIFNSRDQLITDDTLDILVGDFIYCKADDDSGAPIYYGWLKVEPEAGTDLNPDGPNFLSFPNEEDMTNRLYLGAVFGQGFPTAYKCIASDVDPYQDRELLTGANVFFSMVASGIAGDLFEERDYLAMTSESLELKCVRLHPNARVVWRTEVQSGAMVKMLFDSNFPENDLPAGYSWVNAGDENDFTISIDVTEDTAIFTRCSVVYNLLTDIDSRAMIFVIEQTEGGCTANGLENNMDVGHEVTFQGCHFDVTISGDSNLQPEDYTVMTFWNESPSGDPTDYSVVESSRALDQDSVLTVTALEENHQTMYSCALQIHRENTLVKPARAEDLCQSDYEITVADNTGRFRIYHGQRNEMADDDFIHFDTLGRYKTEPFAGGDLTCEFDRNPEMTEQDQLFIEYQSAGENQWVSADDIMIPANEIEESAVYRCVYINDDSDNNNLVSGNIHMVAVVLEVEIVSSSGTVLNENDVYDLEEGDYLECRATVPVSTTYRPIFIWQRAIQLPNVNGPQQVRYDTNLEGDATRMIVSYEYGMGEPIAYRCFGTDNLGRAMIELAGTLVRFQVHESGSSSDSSTHITAGSSSLVAAIFTYLNNMYN